MILAVKQAIWIYRIYFNMVPLMILMVKQLFKLGFPDDPNVRLFESLFE